MWNVKVHRLKINDIVESDDKDKKRVNWDFWRDQIKKHGNFHIFMDEIQNVVHSRMSMSKFNILFSQWIAQIRKVTGANETSDFWCISQEFDRIDIAIRDLAWEIVYCKKVRLSKELILTKVRQNGRIINKMLPKIGIIQTHFVGEGAVMRYQIWKWQGHKTYDYRTLSVLNAYIQFYDSYSFVDFGNEVYL